MMAAGLSSGCHDTLSQLGKVHRLAADLRIQFNKAADASIRAVMADTDEASTIFAREAAQAKQSVTQDADALRPLLQDLGYSADVRLLEDFGRHFAEYQALDRKLLELAVENTNLKAQKLSFGPARESADAFRTALEAVARAAPPKSRAQVDTLVASAVVAVREIQVLHAPHIAESSDAAMTRMEAEMSERFTVASGVLSTLPSLLDPSAQAQLAVASSALDRFKGVHTQILALSRRNSNVHSLELALGQGRALTTACDASLGLLQESLAKEGINPTR
jgi:hypothetical protein